MCSAQPINVDSDYSRDLWGTGDRRGGRGRGRVRVTARRSKRKQRGKMWRARERRVTEVRQREG